LEEPGDSILFLKQIFPTDSQNGASRGTEAFDFLKRWNEVEAETNWEITLVL
jgi:hypothetical protein